MHPNIFNDYNPKPDDGKSLSEREFFQFATPLSEELLQKSKEYNIDDQEYTFDDDGDIEEPGYINEYWQTLEDAG